MNNAAIMQVVEVLADGSARLELLGLEVKVGTRVRVTNPDNSRHPRRGQVGTVEQISHCPATYYRDGTLRDRERWLVWTRFAAQGKPFTVQLGLFNHEIRVARSD